MTAKKIKELETEVLEERELKKFVLAMATVGDSRVRGLEYALKRIQRLGGEAGHLAEAALAESPHAPLADEEVARALTVGEAERQANATGQRVSYETDGYHFIWIYPRVR